MLGIVNDTDFELEKDRLNGVKPEGSIVDITRGRGRGNGDVPEVLRRVIGDNAIEEGNAKTKELARAFLISDSSMFAYKNGSNSTAYYNDADSSLKSHVDETRMKIVTKSRAKLVEAIDKITTEKLEATKARDLAGIAKDMSAVIKNMEPETNSNDNKDAPAFVIYAPQFRDERSFEIMQVRDNF